MAPGQAARAKPKCTMSGADELGALRAVEASPDRVTAVAVVNPCIGQAVVPVQPRLLTAVLTTENTIRCLEIFEMDSHRLEQSVTHWVSNDPWAAWHSGASSTDFVHTSAQAWQESRASRVSRASGPDRRRWLVLGAISNCDARHTPRLAITAQAKAELARMGLENRTRLFGTCLGGQDGAAIGNRVNSKAVELRDTTFAFAFENSAQPDYITEKAFDALSAGAVPVVWGAGHFSAVFGRNSSDADGGHPVFIDATCFASPAHLVRYLAWLEESGEVEKYRPWWLAGESSEAAASAAPRGDPHTLSSARGGGWDCDAQDIVRCGLGIIQSTGQLPVAALDKAIFLAAAGIQGRDIALTDQYKSWLRRRAELALGWPWWRVPGDHSEARIVNRHAERAIAAMRAANPGGERGAVAPWRAKGADPTLTSWLEANPQPAGIALGPHDVVLDPHLCGCESSARESGDQGWCSMRGDEYAALLADRRQYLGLVIGGRLPDGLKPVCRGWAE